MGGKIYLIKVYGGMPIDFWPIDLWLMCLAVAIMSAVLVILFRRIMVATVSVTVATLLAFLFGCFIPYAWVTIGIAHRYDHRWMLNLVDRGKAYLYVAPALFVVSLVASVMTHLVIIRLNSKRMEVRRQAGLCVKCGYDLAGNESVECPECGVGALIMPRRISYYKRKASRNTTILVTFIMLGHAVLIGIGVICAFLSFNAPLVVLPDDRHYELMAAVFFIVAMAGLALLVDGPATVVVPLRIVMIALQLAGIVLITSSPHSTPTLILALFMILGWMGIKTKEKVHGQCVGCGYNLTGTIAAAKATCPECGQVIVESPGESS